MFEYTAIPIESVIPANESAKRQLWGFVKAGIHSINCAKRIPYHMFTTHCSLLTALCSLHSALKRSYSTLDTVTFPGSAGKSKRKG